MQAVIQAVPLRLNLGCYLKRENWYEFVDAEIHLKVFVSLDTQPNIGISPPEEHKHQLPAQSSWFGPESCVCFKRSSICPQYNLILLLEKKKKKKERN